MIEKNIIIEVTLFLLIKIFFSNAAEQGHLLNYRLIKLNYIIKT